MEEAKTVPQVPLTNEDLVSKYRVALEEWGAGNGEIWLDRAVLYEDQILERLALPIDVFADVAAFHGRFQVPNRETLGFLEPPTMYQRLGFLDEERAETLKAEMDRDLSGVVDGLIDTIYVALGTLVQMGLTPEQFAACWQEVQRANMAKVAIPGQWKIGKPEGWTPPNIAGALGL